MGSGPDTYNVDNQKCIDTNSNMKVKNGKIEWMVLKET